MPITITQEKSPLFARRKQKYLMAIFGLVIVLIILLLWWGFLREEVQIPISKGTAAYPAFKKPEINWQLLEDPKLQNLSLFEEAPSYEDEIGRENPFVPY